MWRRELQLSASPYLLLEETQPQNTSGRWQSIVNITAQGIYRGSPSQSVEVTWMRHPWMLTGIHNTYCRAVTKSQQKRSGLHRQSTMLTYWGQKPWLNAQSRDDQVEPPTAQTSVYISCIAMLRTLSLSSMREPSPTYGVNIIDGNYRIITLLSPW